MNVSQRYTFKECSFAGIALISVFVCARVHLYVCVSVCICAQNIGKSEFKLDYARHVTQLSGEECKDGV